MTYIYAFLALASVLCILDSKIDTENLIRAFGFLLIGVGALTKLAGKETWIVWIGVFIVFLTYLNELWAYSQRKERNGRATDK